MTPLEQAIQYVEDGMSVIPVHPETKKPLIEWRRYQERLPREAELESWFEQWPSAGLAVVTGTLTGFVVVDCDNDDAFKAAQSLGFRSPIKVKTRRGWHLWFQHPRDGKWRGPRTGIHSRGEDWPKVPGLDFRGDGSYALLPPTSGYEWQIERGCYMEDAPEWRDWRPTVVVEEDSGEFSFSRIDLTHVAVRSHENESEWDRTSLHCKNLGVDKLPTGRGNGRNERVMRYIAEQVREGLWGPSLRLKGRHFMSHFYEDPLPEREYEDTVRSVEAMHRRNHPEHFDDNGNFIYVPADKKAVQEEQRDKPRRLIVASDAERLIEEGKSETFLIDPWLKPASIVQIYGYSGSGKSLFAQTALYALAAGAREFGCFEMERPARCLYMDWEMSRADVGIRLKDMRETYGDAGENLLIWTPWLEDQDINLRTADGKNALVDWIVWAAPEVVVIDTIRSSHLGMSENDAEQWSQVNNMARKIRDRGIAVILIHHSNKPQEGEVGTYAGSTNQLTMLEVQLRVAQVYRDKAQARINSGVWDDPDSMGIHAKLEAKLPPDYFLSMLIEVSYGKQRQPNNARDPVQYIGWATNAVDGKQMVVSSTSVKQKARALYASGRDEASIAAALRRPLYAVKEWVGTGTTSESAGA